MSPYRMPDGAITKNPNKYAKAWQSLGDKVAKLFPGYEPTGYDPGFLLTRWETSTRTGLSRSVDTINLSLMAVNTLLSGEEPNRVLRDDF